ncbi:hypothetical protein MQX03_06210 [Chryseobacterium aahli]|uniref:hypothetical protein n=1 Tax=Chryseobacterium aahli TaxID=1278643 RepID=UPI001F61830E|nr:hypothetical protein [Chryseobacterium aahli]MCI3936784.1 hypothetical protein [Chryseobacterium aahli]
MKKLLTAIILLTLNQILFSQKKEVYINDNLQIISKEDYKKRGENYRFQNIETDSVLYKVRVEHEGHGKLATVDLNNLKKHLNISDVNNKNIVIHYYQGLDRCNQHSDTNQLVINDIKTYVRKFKKSNLNLYSVYKETKGLKNRLNKTSWIDDRSGAIEKLFFKMHYPCDSAIVIFPDGNYTIFRGEYIWQKVFDTANKTTPNKSF